MPYSAADGYHDHYYTMHYALEATLCMYEATRDTTYLERPIEVGGNDGIQGHRH